MAKYNLRVEYMDGKVDHFDGSLVSLDDGARAVRLKHDNGETIIPLANVRWSRVTVYEKLESDKPHQ